MHEIKKYLKKIDVKMSIRYKSKNLQAIFEIFQLLNKI